MEIIYFIETDIKIVLFAETCVLVDRKRRYQNLCGKYFIG